MRLVRLMWSSASKSTPVQSCYSQLNQAWRTSKNGWANSNSKYQPFRVDSDAALHMNLNSIWVMWTMASEPGLILISRDTISENNANGSWTPKLTFLPLMNAHSALVPVPCAPEGFFPVVCGENWATKLRSWQAGFFPAHHDRGFAGKQQEKKPSGTQGIVPASFAVQCVQRKTHLSKYYKETCARNFSCSYPFCTKHPHGKNLGDRVGRTCLENFACLWKYPATRLFSSTKEKHQPSFGFRHLCENRTT